MGFAVKADATVTFVGLKQGLVTGQAAAYAGDLYFAGLGIEKVSFCRLELANFWLGPDCSGPVPQSFAAMVENTAQRYSYKGETSRLLPLRSRCAHKAHFGKVRGPLAMRDRSQCSSSTCGLIATP